MKKDKSHGQDEGDCRAKLILINGDKVPGVVLEANRKPSTPGESHHAVPRVLPGWERLHRVWDLTAPVPSPAGCGQSSSMAPRISVIQQHIQAMLWVWKWVEMGAHWGAGSVPP